MATHGHTTETVVASFYKESGDVHYTILWMTSLPPWRGLTLKYQCMRSSSVPRLDNIRERSLFTAGGGGGNPKIARTQILCPKAPMRLPLRYAVKQPPLHISLNNSVTRPSFNVIIQNVA